MRSLPQDEKQSQTEAASLIPHCLPLPEVEIDLEAEADGASSGPSATTHSSAANGIYLSIINISAR